MRSCRIAFFWALTTAAVGIAHSAFARTIVSDGSTGTSVSLSETQYIIADGTPVGTNLFHSFKRFGLAKGIHADFQNTTGRSIANIISRVTGESRSNIDGKISAFGEANFFLLNPNGIVFGPKAELDVQGSFYAASADQLRFNNGVFDATSKAAPSPLLTSPPESFGFLAASPADVVVDRAKLRVPVGQKLALLGGNVSVRDSAELGIRGGSGSLEVVAVGGGADVPVQTGALESLAPDARGEVLITDGASMVMGEDPGTIQIVGGEVTIRRSTILSRNLSGTGGGIGIAARNGNVDIVRDGVVLTDAGFQGPGGDVEIFASGDVTISDDSSIGAEASFVEPGGSISIESENLTLRNDGVIQALNRGGGRAGSVDIHVTNEVTMTGDSEITVGSAEAGAAGDITVNAATVQVLGGSQIRAETITDSAGGNIDIFASRLVLVKGQAGAGNFSNISTNTAGAEANAGNIFIGTTEILLQSGGRITTVAKKSDGGSIELQAPFQVRLENSEISAAVTGGEGNGGNVTIDPVFVILINSAIRASAEGGTGGNITIVAENFFNDENSVVDASGRVDGIVEIRAPDTTLVESLVVLPSDFVDPSSRLVERCAARKGRTRGSFVGVGRGGIPATPDDPLPSYVTAGSGQVRGELPVQEDTEASGGGITGTVIPASMGGPWSLVLQCGP